MKGKSGEWARRSVDVFLIFFGTVCYTVSVYVFTAPNEIAPGGVTGFATALHALLPALPIGTVVFLINVPLLLLGDRFLGRRFLAKTLFSTVVFSLTYDAAFPRFLPVYTGDRMLAALFGGVLSGFGLAVVFMRGGSTGGTDITNRILQLKFPYISLGRVVLLSDTVVILFAALVFQNIESAMYAIVTMFVASRAMDSVLYGAEVGKMVTIVTAEPEAICRSVDAAVQRGCTVLPAKGGYTGDRKSVILCAVRKNQFYKVKRAVSEVDPRAFLTVSDASEVVGEGFRPFQDETTL